MAQMMPLGPQIKYMPSKRHVVVLLFYDKCAQSCANPQSFSAIQIIDFCSSPKKEMRDTIESADMYGVGNGLSLCLELIFLAPWKRDVTALELYTYRL